jgi:internalin A
MNESNLNIQETINRAKRENWAELTLDLKYLTTLPKNFETLTNLRVLKLTGKKLAFIPSEIAYLRNLEELHISTDVWGLLRLHEDMRNLKSLRKLKINHIHLNEFPGVIFKMTGLESLDLSGNQLSLIPHHIENLSKLKHLDLNYNPIQEIPDCLFNLTQLETLHINARTISTEVAPDDGTEWYQHTKGKIESLSSEIKKLQKLISLSINDNSIKEIPPEISCLPTLTKIDLRNNYITKLPGNFYKLTNPSLLMLQGNPLPIPPEILARANEPQAILNYYFSTHIPKTFHVVNQVEEVDLAIKVKQKVITTHPMNEAKVLIVGQPSVGKTSLLQQIVDGIFDLNQTKTEGISVKQWTVDSRQQAIDSSSIKLNIWDFGGQEIMHATHQFFLTKRSLYLLVLDSRLTQEENRVEYWLKIIQSFGGDSPVLIVGNKIDQHPLDIDRTGLQKKYPNVVGILESSAATGAGIEALKAEIAKQIDTLPHVRDLLPETWFIVKSKLEELAKNKNFFTKDEYLGLCETNDVNEETSQHTLISFLHDLGVVLHYQDDPRLEVLGILNPQWVTNGVYKILNSHELFHNQGKLTLLLLHRILDLPEYPQAKRLFIVDIMKKFELCYDIDEKSFLIPDLLPKDEPFLDDWPDSLAFQYKYNILPSSIISRFIVRMEAFVHQGTTWRSGTVLIGKKNNALVRADYEDHSISIYVSGNPESRRDFLAVIREEFETIHKTIAKIEITEKVPIASYPGANPPDYNFLLRMERENRLSFPVQAGDEIVDINVTKLLDEIRPSKEVRVFISYSHDDKAFVQRLAKVLGKSQARVWWDFSAIKGGQDWRREIQQGIKLCEFFLVVLTPESVESEWVNREIIFAMEYKKQIIPLYLKQCERPISIIERQYINFGNQTRKAAIKELIELLKVKA